MEVDLVGYLLGALDAQEHEEIRRLLESDPDLRATCEELIRQLRPLRHDAGDYLPPADLAERTVDFVADYEPPSPAPAPVAGGAASGGRRGPRLADVFTSAGMLAAVTLLFFPAIANSRYEAQRIACQNNLRQVGASLSNYSDMYSQYFPYMAAESPYAAAGIYAPLLHDSGFLSDATLLSCPANLAAQEQQQTQIPTLAELQAAKGAELARLRESMGGSYGYTLGYYRDGEYTGVRDQGRCDFAIMSDAPAASVAERDSTNHGSQGQNVLYEDGHVAFQTHCNEGCGDNFFLSQRGFVEAGLDEDDAVIGRSEDRARLFIAAPAPLPVGPAGE